jgi:IS5 family transposase
MSVRKVRLEVRGPDRTLAEEPALIAHGGVCEGGGSPASAGRSSSTRTPANQLTEQIFAEIRALLEERRLLLKSGTIVDATIIAAPPSTKNEQGARDPEMRQTKKGKDWHFGMKAHIGTDRRGIVHSLSTTAANAHDSTRMSKLLHGDEREVFGDQAYWNESHRQTALAAGIRYRINRRPTGGRPLSRYHRFINRRRSAARARVEHAFHVVKRLWGFSKVRYRGLAKNTARCIPLSR